MLETWHFPLLFLTGLAAGFVDSIAGGGGLITVPVLLSFGLGPTETLGTNKLQAVFGSGGASWHYTQARVVSWRECARGFLCSMTGAAIGAITVQQMNPSFLRRMIPVLLLAVAVYLILKPELGVKDLEPGMSPVLFDLTFGVGIGFYDGFFGPGTGTFWAMACMLFLGFNMTRATGYTKVMNFASNLSSLVFFLVGGKALFAAGLTMGAGQLLGARLGSRMVITKGTRIIRPIFLTVVIALTIKLLWDAFTK